MRGEIVMHTLAFSSGKLSSGDLIIGLLGSFLLHIGLFLAATFLSQIRAPHVEDMPFYSVNLVTSEEIRMGSPVPQQAVAEKIATPSPPAQEASVPVVPVKRLQLDDFPEEAELKKLSPSETPKLSEQPSPSIEKSLDKLLPKPQPQPSPPPPTAPQTSGSGVQEPAAPQNQTQEASAQGAVTSDQAETGNGGGHGSNHQEGKELNLLRRLYYGEVWNAIRSQWILPKALMNAKELEATLIIQVRRDGKILNHRFEKRSGNGLFDESVLRAVLKADPLPAFPQAYSPPQEEIGVRFRPEDLS